MLPTSLARSAADVMDLATMSAKSVVLDLIHQADGVARDATDLGDVFDALELLDDTFGSSKKDGMKNG